MVETAMEHKALRAAAESASIGMLGLNFDDGFKAALATAPPETTVGELRAQALARAAEKTRRPIEDLVAAYEQGHREIRQYSENCCAALEARLAEDKARS